MLAKSLKEVWCSRCRDRAGLLDVAGPVWRALASCSVMYIPFRSSAGSASRRDSRGASIARASLGLGGVIASWTPAAWVEDVGGEVV